MREHARRMAEKWARDFRQKPRADQERIVDAFERDLREALQAENTEERVDHLRLAA